jgi:hypothetical protein
MLIDTLTAQHASLLVFFSGETKTFSNSGNTFSAERGNIIDANPIETKYTPAP